MALKKEEDIYKELKTIDGGINAISEYLIAEVLSKQPNNILDYILESSVLNRFCSELIEEITLDKNKIGLRDLRGEELIQWLVKSNMFLVPLDSKCPDRPPAERARAGGF